MNAITSHISWKSKDPWHHHAHHVLPLPFSILLIKIHNDLLFFQCCCVIIHSHNFYGTAGKNCQCFPFFNLFSQYPQVTLTSRSTQLKGWYSISGSSSIWKPCLEYLVMTNWVTCMAQDWMQLWLASHSQFSDHVFSMASSQNHMGYPKSHTSWRPPGRIFAYQRCYLERLRGWCQKRSCVSGFLCDGMGCRGIDGRHLVGGHFLSSNWHC